MQTDYDEEVAFAAARKLYDLARHRPDQPFLLFVSFTNPHDPWEVPARCWERYARSSIPDPVVPSLPLREADPHSRRLRAMCRVDEAELTAQDIRRARHGYFAAISYLDERIGEVLGALRESGLDERTTVLFCADHGEMLGRAGPLVQDVVLRAVGAGAADRQATGCGRARRVTVAGVTAGRRADAAGAGRAPPTVPDGDGVSLLRRARDRPVISEYHGEGVQAPSAMVRSGDHKLIVSREDPDLLYDLAADPQELHDLSASDGARGAAARGAGVAAGPAPTSTGACASASASATSSRRRCAAARHARGTTSPQVDASRQYVRNRDDMYELAAPGAAGQRRPGRALARRPPRGRGSVAP